jgi:xanthine dehydrogenase accessory factor
MRAFRRLVEAIEAEGSAALVTLARVEGSSPREAGTRMVVRPSGGFHGTVGGGALEYAALEAANEALRRGRGPARRRSLALGPELGQCCGGRVEWRVETFDRRDLDDLSALATAEGGALATLSARLEPDGRVQRMLGSGVSERRLARLAEESWTEPLGVLVRAVYLFGAGHVGRALALALAPLLVSAPDSALVVVMTHSHALDLEIVAEALRVERFGYLGLIGSATKRARFLSRMRAAGLTEVQLARLVCPIGVPGLESKDPAVIAASTAAQLLIVSEKLASQEDEAPSPRRRNESPASAL